MRSSGAARGGGVREFVATIKLGLIGPDDWQNDAVLVAVKAGLVALGLGGMGGAMDGQP